MASVTDDWFVEKHHLNFNAQLIIKLLQKHVFFHILQYIAELFHILQYIACNFKKDVNYFKTTNGLHVRMYFKEVYSSHSVGSSIYLLFIHGIHINILNTNLQLILKYHRSVIKL